MKTKTIRLLFSFIMLAIAISFLSSTTVQAAEAKLKNPRISGNTTNRHGARDLSVTYDCITLGNYWQSDTNGDGRADKKDAKTPIKWRVLSVKGNDAYVVADQVLDTQRYHNKCVKITWQKCTMRKWLNSKFLNNAFSKKERKAIKTTKVVDKGNKRYKIKGSKTTKDKIFLMDLNDVATKKYGFTTYNLKKGYDHEYAFYLPHYGGIVDTYSLTRSPTDFAKGLGFSGDKAATATGVACYVGHVTFNTVASCDYWLRSPGSQRTDAAFVNVDSLVEDDGNWFKSKNFGVCPAMHVNLSSKAWKPAGTVTCNFNVGIQYQE